MLAVTLSAMMLTDTEPPTPTSPPAPPAASVVIPACSMACTSTSPLSAVTVEPSSIVASTVFSIWL